MSSSLTERLACLRGVHVTRAGEFKRETIEGLFELADLILEKEEAGRLDELGILKGMVMAPLFFENSSRTFCSFVSAMQKLGGGIVHLPLEQSSIKKGESLEDTIRTMDQYSDVLVLRHPSKEALDQAVAVASHPIMNAGNGTGEHPTQALLDAFTIHRELGSVDGLEIAVVGDLKNGRTTHSLVRLLSTFNVKAFHFVAPEQLAMPEDVCAFLAERKVSFQSHSNLNDVVARVDVIYVTRVQKERFATPEEYQAVAGSYLVDAALLKKAKSRMIVMHPLPRNDELATDVDIDPRAAYFRQMHFGLIMRMALLTAVLDKTDRVPGADRVILRSPAAHTRTGAAAVTTGTADPTAKFMTFTCSNPLMNAAGVMCSTNEELDEMTRSTAGAHISKSCTASRRLGNPSPRYSKIELGSINSMGLPNEGFEYYLHYAQQREKELNGSKPMFFSMSGMALADNVMMAQQLAPVLKSGKIILELNLSCPNVVGKPQVAYDFDTMDQYLQEVSAVLGSDIKFGVKMPPYFDISHFDSAAAILNKYPTVAFVTCINSVGNAIAIDIDTETVMIKPKDGFGGLGGKYVLPTALANVNAFYRRCPEKLVIGCGGACSGEDVFMHILAGASLVQVGTQLHEEGVSVFPRLLGELQTIMERKGYTSIDAFRGKLKTIQ